MDLSKLSAAKLEAELRKRNEYDSKVTRELIRCGMGQFTPRERDAVLRGEQSANDAIRANCKVWRESAESLAEVYAEIYRRERYHGSRKPIRRAA